MTLCVVYKKDLHYRARLGRTSREFFIWHLKLGQVKTSNAKMGRIMRYIRRWFWLARLVKSHPQLGVVSLPCLCQRIAIDGDDETVVVIRWDENSNHVGRLWLRRKRGQDNDLFGLMAGVKQQKEKEVIPILIANNWWMKLLSLLND